MFLRLLWESFRRQKRRKALAGIAILLGTTAVTAMLALATTIGDRIHKELAVYGANIVVYPKADTLSVNIAGQNLKPATGGAYLHESDLAKLKTIFWANNITGVSPELKRSGNIVVARIIGSPTEHLTAWSANSLTHAEPRGFPVTLVEYWFNHQFGDLKTGAPQLHPWWKLQGRWPVEHFVPAHRAETALEIVIGASLAKELGLKIGDSIYMGTELKGEIVGIVTTGDITEQEILTPLATDTSPQPVQISTASSRNQIINSEPMVSRVEISARTKPEDAFARKDPDTLSPAQREIWYCRPYANSIAYQIMEAIPGSQAEQVRRVEQTEGTVLSRISGLMWLISAAALLAACFAVSAAMATAVLERRREIGLMRSLGASRGSIALLFYAETGLLALAAGVLGYLAGSLLASWLGARIFSGDPAGHVLNPVLLPVVVVMALAVAIAGSTPSIRSALRMDPSAVLRGDA